MDTPKVPRRTMEQFCGQVCSFVRFSPDHEAISAKLTGHMEEHRDALLEAHPSMTLWDAESEAVRAMGDPEALGRQLDQIHDHRLGWFQIWFRRVVWTLTVLILLFALPRMGEIITNLTASPSYDGFGIGYLLEHYDEYDVVADFTPNAIWQWNGYTFSIQRAVVTHSETSVYSDEALHLSYLLKVTHSNPWQRGPEFREWLWAEDDLGNRYPSRGQQALYQLPTSAGDSSGNPSAIYPFASYYDLWVGGIHPEATSVTLHFDRFGENAISLTLPLEGGM